MLSIAADVDQQFTQALDHVEALFDVREQGTLLDEKADAQVREWLDGQDEPLPWAGTGVTADEWFFITTLYGQMTLPQQRTHIRKFFPWFVRAAGREIRNVTDELIADWRLRAPFMKRRLSRMADVLRQRGWTMSDYTVWLRERDRGATPEQPMPARDAIFADHRAGEGKTLSCFVRDCVRGNCFPVDSRVRVVLDRFGLSADERLLVSLSLRHGRNPRQIARMFYGATAKEERGAAPTPIAHF